MNKNYLLLTGAGFSRNWGGWVSSEVYDYLLTTPEVRNDSDLRKVLNLHKDNFEYALQIIQEKSSQGNLHQQRLDNLQRAIIKMFDTMDQAFLNKGSLCFVKDGSYTIEKFLERFNVIFTLNQDLLLERCYRTSLEQVHPQGQGPKQWNPHNFPGLVPIDNLNPPDFCSNNPPRYTSQSDTNFKLYPSEHQKFQPIIKLHGSSNWYHNNSAKQLLIMGGNKERAILRFPLLKWYQELLKEYLNKKNTKLMIIGYSFSDSHINSIIIEAIKNYTLELFVIVPSGSDVVVKNRYLDEDDKAIIENAIVGVSRRTLDETFKDTGVEYSKINRFFE